MKRVGVFMLIFCSFALSAYAADLNQLQGVKKPHVNRNIKKLSPDKLKIKHYVQLDKNGDKVVQDNHTGLMWEVKSAKDAYIDYANPNDADNIYIWYDPNQSTNGGFQGYDRNGTDTYDFIKALNAKNFAGYHDWRMPTVEELKTLICEKEGYPKIDLNLFPNTISLINTSPKYYWTSTTYDYSDPPGKCAFVVGFQVGHEFGNHVKSNKRYVRAVRNVKP